MSEKIFHWLGAAVICLLLLIAGCAAPLDKEIGKPEVEPEKQTPRAKAAKPAILALKFTVQDSTTYRVTTEAQRGIKWEGSLPNKNIFKGGQTRNRAEITFTQQIQNVDNQGNSTAKITIESVKYLAKTKNETAIDFDSSREQDPNNPLAKLIGQNYTIEITPVGQVSKIIDVSEAQAAIKGSSSVHKTALRLLSPDAIKRRHGTLILPAADQNQLRTGDNWSGIKTFSFGLMGPKSYERIYTLKEIEEIENRQIAVVEMDAIPSSEMIEQLHKEQATKDFSKIFDNTETYTGQLKLDSTSGKVEKYLEKLQSEWVVVEPPPKQESDKEPSVLTMSATRLYILEKID